MSSAPDNAAPDRGTILFVDDEPLSQKYFKASVGKYANVLTASGPEAALQILASGGEAISVVVSDERMPRESGVAFLTSVRKSWPSTVRILTSAYADIDNLQQAINGAGVYRFVPKPWDFDELCTAMRDALATERVAEKAAAFEGRLSTGDAESANAQLLAVLARELAVPLASIDDEALQLAVLTGPKMALPTASASASHLAAWSARLRFGKIAASADRVLRDIRHCRSLAASIGELAAGLCEPLSVTTPSMAETVSDVLDQMAANRAGGKFTLDARSDFRYRAPKSIMNFVLAKLLQGATERGQGAPATVAIELMPAVDCNEVRITAERTTADADTSNREFDRSARCALWAFGGELIDASDENSGGTTTTILRLPKTPAPEDVFPSR